MNNFGFWQKWLLVFSLYLVLMGLVLACFGQSNLLNDILNQHINPVFWSSKKMPVIVIAYQAWLYAVLGAVIMAWGIIMTYIIIFPFNNKEKWAWSCLFISSTLWYAIDTTYSTLYNVMLNVGFNTLLYALIILPLLFTRKHFFA